MDVTWMGPDPSNVLQSRNLNGLKWLFLRPVQ